MFTTRDNHARLAATENNLNILAHEVRLGVIDRNTGFDKDLWLFAVSAEHKEADFSKMAADASLGYPMGLDVRGFIAECERNAIPIRKLGVVRCIDVGQSGAIRKEGVEIPELDVSCYGPQGNY